MLQYLLMKFKSAARWEAALLFSCEGSGEPSLPVTRFNYTEVRSQWELVKPLWLFSSGALHLSLPDDDTAQHYTIIHKISPHTCPVEDDF